MHCIQQYLQVEVACLSVYCAVQEEIVYLTQIEIRPKVYLEPIST